MIKYNKQNNITNKKQKQLFWDVAIGLNQVDNLTPSKYLIQESKSHINGDITLEQVEEELQTYYINHKNQIHSPEYECDIVSKRIVDLLSQPAFTFSVATLNGIHKYLFKDVLSDEIVGKFRTYNITKEEPIINNKSVIYANYNMIEDTLAYNFKEEKKHTYSYPFSKDDISHACDFTSNIWQVHPFGEGNTRTIAVFIQLYFNIMGYDINNDLFKSHSKYFRNALVRSNFYDAHSDVHPTNIYLNKFFWRLLTSDNSIQLVDSQLVCREMFPTWKPNEINKTTNIEID